MKTEYAYDDNNQYIDRLLNNEHENISNKSNNKKRIISKNLNSKKNKENVEIRENTRDNKNIKENKESKENKENLRDNKEKTNTKVPQNERIKMKAKIQKKQTKIQVDPSKNNYTSNTTTKSCRAQPVYPPNLAQTIKKIEPKNTKNKKISLYTISNINNSFEHVPPKNYETNPKNVSKYSEESSALKSYNNENTLKINKIKNIREIKVYLPNDENQYDQEVKINISNKIERFKTDMNKRLKRDINKLRVDKRKKTPNSQINNTTGNLQNNITENGKKLSFRNHKKIDTNCINNLNSDEVHYHKINNVSTNATAKKIKRSSKHKQIIDPNIPREQTFIYNLDNNSISTTNKNYNINQGMFYGKKILNKYKILENNNNYKHSYINTNVNDYSYRKPLVDFDSNKNNTNNNNSFQLRTENFSNHQRAKAIHPKNYSNSVGYKLNSNLHTKKHLYTRSKINNLSSISKVTNYNKIRNTPHYIIKKNNNYINTNKFTNNNSLKIDNVFKNGCIDLKRNQAISSVKRKPSLTIRNTVINLNMIETGLLVTPALNKRLDLKRANILNNGRLNVPRPQSRYIINSQPKTFYTKIIPQNRYTNTNTNTNTNMRKNSRFSHYNYRISERISSKTKSNFIGNMLSDNQSNSSNNRNVKDFCFSTKNNNTGFQVNSINQLIKKYRYPEFLERLSAHSNSVEKKHAKYNSMKIDNVGHNERIKNMKQMQPINNINYNLNSANSLNRANVGAWIGSNNYNLPSLIVNKMNLSNNKGYLVQDKPKYFYTNVQQQEKNDNRIRQFHLKGINQKLIK